MVLKAILITEISLNAFPLKNNYIFEFPILKFTLNFKFYGLKLNQKKKSIVDGLAGETGEISFCRSFFCLKNWGLLLTQSVCA